LGRSNAKVDGIMVRYELMEAVRDVVEQNNKAAVKPGERVLVIAEEASSPVLVDAFMAAAHAAKAVPILMIFPTGYPHCELHEAVAEAMKKSDVVFDLSTVPHSYSQAYKEAMEAGARIVFTYGANEMVYLELMLGFDPVYGKDPSFDHEEMLEKEKRLCELFTKASTCKVLSKKGTNITVTVKGREPTYHGMGAYKPGVQDGFPGGIVSVPPVEESGNGVLVVDGSLRGVGLLKTPVKLTLQNGRITKIEGGVEAEKFKQYIEKFDDPRMYLMAHINIGVNPKARLTGTIFEDEKILGSTTWGFGSQMPGWRQNPTRAKSHIDATMLDSTLLLDDKVIIQDGKFTSL